MRADARSASARTIADDARVRGELERIFGSAGVREGAPEDAAG